MRFQVYKRFKEAKNWPELERGLARHGLRLERLGGGLVVTDGKRRVKASRIYRRGSYKWLEQRFGTSFEEWRSQRRGLLDAVDRYQQAERQERDLGRRRDRALAEVERHQRAVDERRQVRDDSRRNAREIRRTLERIYRPEDVPKVERHLVRRARQVG